MNLTDFPITLILLASTILVSVICFRNQRLFDLLKFNAYHIYHSREIWRFVTNIFVHVDIMHLAFNMYALFLFGDVVEMYLKVTYADKPGLYVLFYLLLYLGAGVVSSIYSFEKHKNDLWYNAVGASGSVSALVFAFIAIAPTAKLGLIILPGVHIPGFILGFLYLGYSWYMSRRKSDNIGHDAHFFGALFGFVFMFIIQPPLFRSFIHEISTYFSGIF